MNNKNIRSVIRFSLPNDWDCEDNEYNQAQENTEDTSVDIWDDVITHEGAEALKEHLEDLHEQNLQDISEWPRQLNALPKWSTNENYAAIDIFTSVSTYTDQQLNQAQEFLNGERQLTLADLCDSHRGCNLFSLWYVNHERSRLAAQEHFETEQGKRFLRWLEEIQPQKTAEQLAKEAAWKEALNEIEANMLHVSKDLAGTGVIAQSSINRNNVDRDFKILNTSSTKIKGRPAAAVNCEEYLDGKAILSTSLHFLVDTEKQYLTQVCASCQPKIGWTIQTCQHKDQWPVELGTDPPATPFYWHALELHIFLSSTAANDEYLQPDFRAFLQSIDWII